MKRLSRQQIDNIIQDHSKGEKVSSIAKKYGIAVMVVHYHIKKGGIFFVAKPKCYNDYLKNEIVRLEQKILENPEKKLGLQSEINRLKNSMGIKRDRCSSDTFIIQ